MKAKVGSKSPALAFLLGQSPALEYKKNLQCYNDNGSPTVSKNKGGYPNRQ